MLLSDAIKKPSKTSTPRVQTRTQARQQPRVQTRTQAVSQQVKRKAERFHQLEVDLATARKEAEDLRAEQYSAVRRASEAKVQKLHAEYRVRIAQADSGFEMASRALDAFYRERHSDFTPMYEYARATWGDVL